MQFKQNSRIIYLAGQVRVLEKRMISIAEYNRLMENNEPRSFINELSDTSYGRFIEKNGFDDGLDKHLISAYNYFRKNISENTVVLDIFFIKNMVADFKNYLKKTEKISSTGSGLAVFFQKVLKRIYEITGRTEEAEDVLNIPDKIIEKALVDTIYEKYVKEIKINSIVKYWRYMVDIKNLLKNINHPAADYYWDGGYIPADFWKVSKITDDVPEKLVIQPYYKKVASESNFVLWEPILKKWLGGLLKDMKKISLSIEPVVSYFLCLMEEMTNLKLIYTGIRMKMSVGEIRKQLNISYI